MSQTLTRALSSKEVKGPTLPVRWAWAIDTRLRIREFDNLNVQDTEKTENHLDQFLHFERARGEIGQYYTHLQELLGQRNELHGGIMFPAEFERFETDRANSLEERLEFGITRDFHDDLSNRKLSSRGVQESVRLGETLISRDLFITDQGNLGLGPSSLEVGDEVWILTGMNVPLILRSVDGKGHYRLIGETYVHGIMHGEAAEETPETNVREVKLL